MMPQMLVLDDPMLAALDKLRRIAEAHPFSQVHMQAMVARTAPVLIPDMPDFSVTLPVDVRVTFTIEHHPGSVMRHLSVSVGGKLPAVPLVAALLPALGFVGEMEDCLLFVEDGYAINVLEPLADDPT